MKPAKRSVIVTLIPLAFVLFMPSLALGVSFPPAPDWLRSVPDSGPKTLGDTRAPVTITEYTDLECPYCRRFTKRTFPKIVKQYVQNGIVQYRIQHFPLPMHEHALSAANAAECAAQQDRFWAYKHFLMNFPLKMDTKNLTELGYEVGVADRSLFRECVRSMKNKSIVLSERQSGRDRGVRATPTFLVRSGDRTYKLEGALPFNRFKKWIEKARADHAGDTTSSSSS